MVNHDPEMAAETMLNEPVGASNPLLARNAAEMHAELGAAVIKSVESPKQGPPTDDFTKRSNDERE